MAGVKTSEFWLTLFTTNVMLFNDALGWGLTETTVMSMAGLVVTYIAGRSYFKTRVAAE